MTDFAGCRRGASAQLNDELGIAQTEHEVRQRAPRAGPRDAKRAYVFWALSEPFPEGDPRQFSYRSKLLPQGIERTYGLSHRN